MRTVAIITDSSSGITQQEAANLGIVVVPLRFSVDETEYEEGVTLSREFFFEKQAEGAVITTAQPSPQRILDAWDHALEAYEQVLHIPISGDLSGSCLTAMAMAREETYEGRVLVADAHRIATPLRQGVMDALVLAEEGHDGAYIKEKLEARDSAVYLAVDTLKYLQQGGRISAATAVVGTVLSIKPLLKLNRAIEVAGKIRGMKQARKQLIGYMKRELETNFADVATPEKLYLMAASAASEEVTADWVREIETAFPSYTVICDDLSLSICCHTGPNALGIGCAAKLSN